MPYPKRRDLAWSQLDNSIQRALLWLNACTLLSEIDLLAIAWPPGGDRQRKTAAVKGWVQDALVVPTDDGAAYRIGENGAAKLRDAGFDVKFEASDPAYRVRMGLLLAGRFAVGLALDLLDDLHIEHLSWASTPFSGAGPRADGLGGVCYSADCRPLRAQDSLDILFLTTAGARPAAGRNLMQLILEIDLGTETSEQLEQRAARWGAALRAQRAALPARCWPYVMWVTDGGWDRAQTIWRAWIRMAALPLFITTSSSLRIAGRWHPWQAMWRDEHGRPRTLNPYAGQEMVWRFEESPPPACSSLERAIAVWEATQRV